MTVVSDSLTDRITIVTGSGSGMCRPIESSGLLAGRLALCGADAARDALELASSTASLVPASMPAPVTAAPACSCAPMGAREARRAAVCERLVPAP